MPSLPHAQKNIKIDFKDIRVGGKPFMEWATSPHAAILAGLAVVLIGVLWYVFRPTRDAGGFSEAWNMAAMTDTVPAYQLYMREQPSGYFRGQAEDRMGEMKGEADKAFAKAKLLNTATAYASRHPDLLPPKA